MQPCIEGHVVRLRDFRTDDVALVVSASADPVIPLITTVPAAADEEAAQQYIARQNTRLTSGVGYAYAIARTLDDVAIGYIGLTHLEEGRASIGYWIGSDHRGRSYAAVALRLLGDWALADLALPRLELYAEPWNEASIRTAEAAGFEREGLMRSWRSVGGARRDMWMYSRINES